MVIHTIPDPEANKNLKSFLKSVSSIRWDTTSSRRIYNLKNENLVGKPVKLVGYIHSISDPKPVEISGKRITHVQMSIKDRSNDQIKVLDVYDEKMQKKLKESFLKQQLCTFYGTVFSIISKEDSEYIFHLENFKPDVTAEDLIEIQYELKNNRFDIFIKKIATQKDKFKYFKSKHPPS